LKLRTISSLGKSSSPDISDRARDIFGAPVNFGFSTLETGIVVAGCERWFPARKGSAGRAVPGHRMEVLDAGGQILPAGRKGRIAVDRRNPALLVEYLNDPKMTADAFDGDWFITGDHGFKDNEGYLYILSQDHRT
jgi:acetyl-CoA synthetase